MLNKIAMLNKMKSVAYTAAMLFAADGPNLDKAISPVYAMFKTIIPIALTVLCFIGPAYCIVLGVNYAKSDENGTHEKAKKDLIHGIIGFLIIFVLMGVMWLVREPLITWLDALTDNWTES